MSTKFLVISLLIATGILLIGCTAQQTPTTPSPSGETVVFTVTASDFSFDPSQLNVKPGQPVTVNFKNRGAVVHTFTIPDLGLNTGPIQPGSDRTVAFNAPTQAGSHEFLCTIAGHADQGMKGTITIG